MFNNLRLTARIFVFTWGGRGIQVFQTQYEPNPQGFRPFVERCITFPNSESEGLLVGGRYTHTHTHAHTHTRTRIHAHTHTHTHTYTRTPIRIHTHTHTHTYTHTHARTHTHTHTLRCKDPALHFAASTTTARMTLSLLFSQVRGGALHPWRL